MFCKVFCIQKLRGSGISGFDGLGEDYLASVKEQMKKFTEDPEMLQQALKPFMEVQRFFDR